MDEACSTFKWDEKSTQILNITSQINFNTKNKENTQLSPKPAEKKPLFRSRRKCKDKVNKVGV